MRDLAFGNPSFPIHLQSCLCFFHTLSVLFLEMLRRQVNSCDVKVFPQEVKCPWTGERCERYSCCGNCKAVLKAVTILYFRPPALPPSHLQLNSPIQGWEERRGEAKRRADKYPP